MKAVLVNGGKDPANATVPTEDDHTELLESLKQLQSTEREREDHEYHYIELFDLLPTLCTC